MIRQPGDEMEIFEEEGNDDQVMENNEQEPNSNSDH
jgi:hypothetical protein